VIRAAATALPPLARPALALLSLVLLSLVPRFQYVPVAGHAARTDGGTIAGAFGG
jgi:hypothetical protein